MQRLYIILAGFSCFIGILLVKNAYLRDNILMKRLLAFSFLLFFFWNSYQTIYFLKFGQFTVKSTSNFWLNPENMYFIANGLLPIHNDINPNHFDPRLKNRVLNERQKSIPQYDNEAVVIKECAKQFTTPDSKMFTKTKLNFPALFATKASNHILSMTAPANNRLLLCLETDLNSAGVNLAVIKNEYGFNSALNASIGASQIRGLHKKIIAVPIFHYGPEELNVYLSPVFRDDLKPKEVSTVTLKAYALISYDPEHLPIHIESFTPYKASVETNTNNVYLEIFKEYFPGYKAKVDGEEITVLASQEKRMVMIPLKNKGFHEIELFYVGTPLMRVAFYISTFAWSIVFAYFGILAYRKYLAKKESKIALAFSP